MFRRTDAAPSLHPFSKQNCCSPRRAPVPTLGSSRGLSARTFAHAARSAASISATAPGLYQFPTSAGTVSGPSQIIIVFACPLRCGGSSEFRIFFLCFRQRSNPTVNTDLARKTAQGRLSTRYVSRARLRAARSHSFPPRRSYFARSASVTRSRIIAVCASSGGSAGRPRAFFGAGLFIAATQVFAQPECFSRVQPLVALRARVG